MRNLTSFAAGLVLVALVLSPGLAVGSDDPESGFDLTAAEAKFPLPLTCSACAKGAPVYGHTDNKWFSSGEIVWPGGNDVAQRMYWNAASTLPANSGVRTYQTQDNSVPPVVLAGYAATQIIKIGQSGAGFADGWVQADFQATVSVTGPIGNTKSVGLYYGIWVQEDTDDDGDLTAADCKPAGGDDCGYLDQTMPPRAIFLGEGNKGDVVRFSHVFRRTNEGATTPLFIRARLDFWALDTVPGNVNGTSRFTFNVTGGSFRIWVGDVAPQVNPGKTAAR